MQLETFQPIQDVLRYLLASVVVVLQLRQNLLEGEFLNYLSRASTLNRGQRHHVVGLRLRQLVSGITACCVLVAFVPQLVVLFLL